MPAAVGGPAPETRRPAPQPEETEGGVAKSGLAFLRRFKKDD
jgi:hypothetical protein